MHSALNPELDYCPKIALQTAVPLDQNSLALWARCDIADGRGVMERPRTLQALDTKDSIFPLG